MDIAKYAQDTYTNLDSVSQGQIPTALLLASVNTPDHSAMFYQLSTTISSQGGHVAIIEPGSDTSSAKAIIASVARQLMECEEQENLQSSSPKRCSPVQSTKKTVTQKSALVCFV